MRNKLMIITVVALLSVALILGLIIFVVSTRQGRSPFGQETPAPTEQSTASETESPSETPEITEEPTEEPTPTPGPLAGLIIGIDPGHQASGNSEKEPCAPWGSDKNSSVNNGTMKAKTTSGTAGKFTNIPEYIATLQISLKIRDKLESLGATVVMTRETHEVNLSNIDRAVICNEAGCDVVLRIHCNGAENPDVNGVEAWVRGNGDGTAEYKALGEYEKKLAEELLLYFSAATGATKRNVNRSDNYTGLNWSTVPSIIIECGFMSNREEDVNLTSEPYQELIAEGIANWLMSTTSLEKKAASGE